MSAEGRGEGVLREERGSTEGGESGAEGWGEGVLREGRGSAEGRERQCTILT